MKIACLLPVFHDDESAPFFNLELLFKSSHQGVTLRNFGSAALSLAYIAAGKIDAFWMYNLYPWDLAAGQILIEEAGGFLTRYERRQAAPHSACNVLATNQALHVSLSQYLLH